jgi:ectoine hydroxylase-related dioxygenase (phytanoyl-CoA dioxygenase family)
VKHDCKPSYFSAGKGDVLIWHANLIHGGSPRKNMQLSRRAMVCHYFVKGAVTYHDLASSLAHPHTGTCLLRKQDD